MVTSVMATEKRADSVIFTHIYAAAGHTNSHKRMEVMTRGPSTASPVNILLLRHLMSVHCSLDHGPGIILSLPAKYRTIH